MSIILVLGTILFIKFLPFLGGILGAFTVYILVRKQMIKLTEVKKMHKGLAAALLLLDMSITVLTKQLMCINHTISLFIPCLSHYQN